MALCSRTLLLVTIGTIAFLYLGVSRRHELGVKDFVLLAGRFILALALFSLLISYVTPWIQSYSVASSRISPSNVSEVEQEQRKRLARKEQQEKLSEKANVYMDSVLKPRQDVKLRKQEEHFFRMTGQTWKLTEGQRLGVSENEVYNSYNSLENVDTRMNEKSACHPPSKGHFVYVLVGVASPSENLLQQMQDQTASYGNGMHQMV
ncbi:UBX domain-containing protein 8 [Lissotriton helveticus]